MARVATSVEFPKNGKPSVINNMYTQSAAQSHIYLSSLTDIPPLPCYATMTDIGGYELRVQITEIDLNKCVVKYKKLNKKGNVSGGNNHIEEYKIKKIEFENGTKDNLPTDSTNTQ